MMSNMRRHVVGMYDRVSDLVVQIRMQVQESIGPLRCESGEDIEQARQHLARLIAAVRKHYESPFIPELRFGSLAALRWLKDVQVHAVGNVFALNAAIPRPELTVPAH